MKSLLSVTSLMLLLTVGTGCYCCRQSYDPCRGSSYACKEWGFALFDRGCGCGAEGGCDTACDACEPACGVPYDHGHGYPVESAPTPTYQQNSTPPAAPAPTQGDEMTGWTPTTARHPVHPVSYPRR